MNVVNKILVGYDKLEPILLTCASLGFNSMLLGRHGIGKTQLVKALGRSFDRIRGSEEQGYRYFDAAKANLIIVAGLPNIEATRESGELEFTRTRRSIIGEHVSIVLVDEITRANKENQNMWLEILEEKTLHGKPLHYDAIMATANPETYSGTFALDAALYDRFMAVIPLPIVLDECDEDAIVNMIEVNKNRRNSIDEITGDLADLIGKIRTKYQELLADPETHTRVSQFIAAFYNTVEPHRPTIPGPGGKSEKLYISARNVVDQLYRLTIGLTAYYTVVGNQKPLFRAAQEAIKYNIQCKMNNDELNRTVGSALMNLRFILDSDTSTAEGQLTMRFARIKTLPSYVKFIQENIDEIDKLLAPDAITSMVGTVINKAKMAGDRSFLPKLMKLTEGRDKFGHIRNEAYGEVVFAVLDKCATSPRGSENLSSWDAVEKFLHST